MGLSRGAKEHMEPTIVLAGMGNGGNLAPISRAKPNAMMFSFVTLRGNKSIRQRVRDGFEWKPRMYLDSGAFTILRKAGVMGQSSSYHEGKDIDVKQFCKDYVEYLRTDGHLYDHVIELDIDEIYGIPMADKLRAMLTDIVGRERLMPVWHAHRGLEGWRDMINNYSYVAFSLGRQVGGAKNRRNHSMFRAMIREAHDVGTYVHMLGMTTLDAFEAYGVDSADSSAWSMGARFGEFKVLRGKVTLPKHTSKTRRPIAHAHLAQLADMAREFGLSLEDIRTHPQKSMEFGARIFMHRQEELRRARIATQEIG